MTLQKHINCILLNKGLLRGGGIIKTLSSVYTWRIVRYFLSLLITLLLSEYIVHLDNEGVNTQIVMDGAFLHVSSLFISFCYNHVIIIISSVWLLATSRCLLYTNVHTVHVLVFNMSYKCIIYTRCTFDVFNWTFLKSETKLLPLFKLMLFLQLLFSMFASYCINLQGYAILIFCIQLKPCI